MSEAVSDREAVEDEERKFEDEEYAARARVIMAPGVERNDFCRLLDGLAEELDKIGDEVGAEMAADLASILEGLQ